MRVERHSKTCSNCSQSLPARANFCFECGHANASPGNLRMRVPTELFGEESSEFFPTFEA
jgi:predicted amidophosphoribosyltransferase